LSLTGISTRSLLAFQALCYLGTTFFTYRLLRAYRYPLWSNFAIALPFAFWMSARGLRPEAFSMLLLAAGLWCLTRDRPLRYFWGFALLGGALLSLPVNLIFSAALGGMLVASHAGQRYRRQELTFSYGRDRLLALLGAIALDFTLLLLCIDFRLSQFLADLSWHSALRRAPLDRFLPSVLFLFRIGYNEIQLSALYTLYALLLVLLWRRWAAAPLTLKVPSLTLAIATPLSLVAYYNTLTYQFNFFCWLGAMLVLAKLPLGRLTRSGLIALALLILTINQSSSLVALLAQDRTVDPAQVTAIRDYVRQHPDKTYLIDATAARVAFDYRLPTHSLDWAFFDSKASPFAPSSLAQKTAHEVWVIASRQAWYVPELPDYPRAQLFGRTFTSISRYPYQLLLVE